MSEIKTKETPHRICIVHPSENFHCTRYWAANIPKVGEKGYLAKMGPDNKVYGAYEVMKVEPCVSNSPFEEDFTYYEVFIKFWIQ